MRITNKEGQSYGGLYEDFEVGQVKKHWPGKTITESDNNLFCLLTRNDNPLHSDAHYMSEHQHGKILVNGALVFSLVVGISVRDTSGQAIANLEYEKIVHNGPVFLGDTIYAETEILGKRETSKGDRGIIHVESRAHNQHGEQVLTSKRRRFLVGKGSEAATVGDGGVWLGSLLKDCGLRLGCEVVFVQLFDFVSALSDDADIVVYH